MLFESPRRLGSTLAELAEALGCERRACVARRELTKLHESLERGTLQALAARFAEGARGEGDTGRQGLQRGCRRRAGRPRVALRAAFGAGLGPAEAAREVARSLGVARREGYARALVLRREV